MLIRASPETTSVAHSYVGGLGHALTRFNVALLKASQLKVREATKSLRRMPDAKPDPVGCKGGVALVDANFKCQRMMMALNALVFSENELFEIGTILRNYEFALGGTVRADDVDQTELDDEVYDQSSSRADNETPVLHLILDGHG